MRQAPSWERPTERVVEIETASLQRDRRKGNHWWGRPWHRLEDAHRRGCRRKGRGVLEKLRRQMRQGGPKTEDVPESLQGTQLSTEFPAFSEEIRGVSLEREGPRDRPLCTDLWAHPKKNGAPSQSSWREKICLGGFWGCKASLRRVFCVTAGWLDCGTDEWVRGPKESRYSGLDVWGNPTRKGMKPDHWN